MFTVSRSLLVCLVSFCLATLSQLTLADTKPNHPPMNGPAPGMMQQHMQGQNGSMDEHKRSHGMEMVKQNHGIDKEKFHRDNEPNCDRRHEGMAWREPACQNAMKHYKEGHHKDKTKWMEKHKNKEHGNKNRHGQ